MFATCPQITSKISKKSPGKSRTGLLLEDPGVPTPPMAPLRTLQNICCKTAQFWDARCNAGSLDFTLKNAFCNTARNCAKLVRLTRNPLLYPAELWAQIKEGEGNHAPLHCNHGSAPEDVDLAFASAQLERWPHECAPGHLSLQISRHLGIR